jgi:hypothetical protein
MTVPSTNIKFSDIWEEANGTYSTGILSLNTMSFFSYFSGPNGANAQPDENWGQGENSGANRIYGTTPKITNIKVGDFSNLTYYYDQTNFQIVLDIKNNAIKNPDDDVTVNLTLWDSGLSYSYNTGGAFVPAAGGSNTQDTSAPTTPIINTGYWQLDIITGPAFTGNVVSLDINGNSIMTPQALAPNTTNTFDWNGFSSADVSTYLGVTGLYFYVEIT